MPRREHVLNVLRTHQPIVAPSMLKCDFGRLGDEIASLESAHAEWLHWDVMDGHFVPNLSYGALVIEPLRTRTEAVFEAHLMISEPARYLDDYLKAGCDAMTFHVETESDPRGLLRRIRDAGAVAGLACNPATPASEVLKFAEDCDLVLVMSVEPGFGGQAFMPASLEKLETLRNSLPEAVTLAVDGGIGKDTIGRTAAAGAGLFVVGSAIFGERDYHTAIENLHATVGSSTAAGKQNR